MNVAEKNNSWEWQASLTLGLAFSARGTQLKRCRHRGPLYVQKPFYPEGRELAHIYLLHPPGGLVSGDALSIQVDAAENTKVLITTPGAARVYRARDTHPVQKQAVILDVGQQASMEWFPMETIIYDGAHAELNTTIKLQDNSTFMGWEITCLGLPASDKPFSKGSLLQRYRIEKNGLPLYIDRLHYSPEKSEWSAGKAGMQNNTATGFFIAGPFECNDDLAATYQVNTASDLYEKMSDTLRLKIESLGVEKYFAVTWVNQFCIIRYLGGSAFQARDGFIELWSLLRPALIKRKANVPGIWKT